MVDQEAVEAPAEGSLKRGDMEGHDYSAADYRPNWLGGTHWRKARKT